MSTADRLTVVSMGVAVVLAVTAGSCSTNARIGDLRADMNARFATLDARFAALDARFAVLDARVSDLRTELADFRAQVNARFAALAAEIDELRADLGAFLADVQRIDHRLRAVERAVAVEPPGG